MALTTSGVMPVHKATGKKSPNAMNRHKIEPLMRHLQYLTHLGEVRATCVVSTIVKGMEERTNRDMDDDAIYLPRYMTIRSCYKRYMNMLGYNVRTLGSGANIIDQDDGKDIEKDENFVSFPTYFYTWKTKFPNLKVSTPIEDICQHFKLSIKEVMVRMMAMTTAAMTKIPTMVMRTREQKMRCLMMEAGVPHPSKVSTSTLQRRQAQRLKRRGN